MLFFNHKILLRQYFIYTYESILGWRESHSWWPGKISEIATNNFRVSFTPVEIHCGQVMPNGDTDLGQNGLLFGGTKPLPEPIACRVLYLKVISQEIPTILILDMTLRISSLGEQPHVSATNYLIIAIILYSMFHYTRALLLYIDRNISLRQLYMSWHQIVTKPPWCITNDNCGT